jgi:glycosyltransferase involved in cell wall biosynthesis
MPRITVLMPVWNAERFLAQAVESILNQSFKDFELLVVDGGSTDRTLDILSQFNDPRIRVIKAPPGIVAALNLGLQQAKGDWIARQDADDVSHPQRLEQQWEAVSREPETVFCHTNVELIGNNVSSVGRSHFPRTQGFLALKLCFQCGIVHSTAFFKKETALAVGGYQGEQAEDYGLWGRLVENGRAIGLPKRLLKFRVHEVSASKRYAKTMEKAAHDIGIAHCQRFMRLSSAEAERAHTLLQTSGRQRHWNEWRWFLRHCLPRLRWKSFEMYSWIVWQTLKTVCRRPENIRAARLGKII